MPPYGGKSPFCRPVIPALVTRSATRGNRPTLKDMPMSIMLIVYNQLRTVQDVAIKSNDAARNNWYRGSQNPLVFSRAGNATHVGDESM